MRSQLVPRLVALLAATICLASLTMPAPPAAASLSGAHAQRTRHPRFYGYLMDRSPATDSTIDVYSRAHKTTYHIVMTRSTVVKVRTQTVPRSRLQYQMYVIVTCQRSGDGTLIALTVHIENRRLGQPSRTRKKRTG